jgi:SAM-dependent methyltransferase
MSLLSAADHRDAAGIIERRLAVRPYISDDRFSTGRLDGAMGFSRSDDQEAERQSRPTFADTFRGDPALVTERQRMYLPFFAPGELVVDLGCGRGEFLELLTRRGVRAEGVELNAPLARAGRRRGLEISEEDALEYLAGTEPATLDGVFSAQFVEHVDPSRLEELLVLTRRALRPGGICIAETVNPENFEALKTFHVDLTHHKPIFPQVLLHLFWEAGFDCAWVYYPLGGGFTQLSYDAVGEYAVVAQA